MGAVSWWKLTDGMGVDTLDGIDWLEEIFSKAPKKKAKKNPKIT